MIKYKIWIAVGLIFGYLIYLMAEPFADVLIYAIFVYYISRPLYRRLLKITKRESLSAFISIFLLIFPVSIVFLWGMSIAVAETLRFISSLDASYARAVGNFLAQHSKSLQELSFDQWISLAGRYQNIQDTITVGVNLIFRSLDILLRLILVYTSTTYLLIDGPRLRSWMVKVPYPNETHVTAKFFDKIDKDLHSVFYGSIQTSILMAIVAFLVFTGLNTVAPQGMMMKYTILTALMIGIASLVPMVGAALVYLPVTAVMAVSAHLNGNLMADGWFTGLFLASCLIFDYAINMVFKPHVAGKGTHQGLMLLAFLLGPLAFGPSGLFLGPIAVVVMMNYAKIIMPRIRN